MCEKEEFEYEYYLQQITNKNLKYLFNLEYLTEEFQLPGLGDNGPEKDESIKSLKVDGLAYDEETKSFVVLEYKKELNHKVLRQGRRYYKNFEEKFEHYNRKIKTSYTKQIEKLHEQIKAIDKIDDDFDLSISKVIIISPEFSDAQIEHSKNPKYPYELYTVCLCKIDEEKSRVLYKKINHSPKKDNDTKELLVSSDDLEITRYALLENKSTEVKELYDDFENRLFEQFNDDLDIRYIVNAVAIKAYDKHICLIVMNKNSIKIQFYIKKIEETYEKRYKKNKPVAKSKKSNGNKLFYNELLLEHADICYAIELIDWVCKQKVEK